MELPLVSWLLIRLIASTLEVVQELGLLVIWNSFADFGYRHIIWQL
jgi:hypothetical protein